MLSTLRKTAVAHPASPFLKPDSYNEARKHHERPASPAFTPPSRISSRLPPEITDLVITFVWPDRESLTNCSLVCRDWKAKSAHLLHQLRWVSIADYSTYDDLVAETLRGDGASRLARSTYLQTLWISDEDDDRPAESRITHRVIHDFAGHLPNLRTLLICDANWILCPPHPSAPLALSTFSSLHTLSLLRCRLPSCAFGRRLITALPNVHKLEFWDVWWPPIPRGTPLPVPDRCLRPALSWLTLRCSSADSHTAAILQNWLLKTDTSTTLRTLRFGCDDDSWKQNSMYFLMTIGPCLTELGLTLHDYTELPLFRFTNLKVLILTIATGGTMWQELSSLLLRLPAHLETLYVSQDPEASDLIAEIPEVVEILEALFEQARFEELQELHLSFRTMHTGEDEIAAMERFCGQVQATLPRLCARVRVTININYSFKTVR